MYIKLPHCSQTTHNLRPTKQPLYHHPISISPPEAIPFVARVGYTYKIMQSVAKFQFVMAQRINKLPVLLCRNQTEICRPIIGQPFSFNTKRKINNVCEDEGINKLEKIKKEGLDQLQASASDLSNSSLGRKGLMDNPAKREVSVKQRRRAAHLERLICEVLEKMELKGDESFCCEGESIEISFVEVSPDLRHARVYWTLPLTMLDRPESDIRHYTTTMKHHLEMGGAGYIQKRISALMRNGYPPRIRFIATDTMLSHSENVRRELRRHNVLDKWEI